jgi:hypothetical protein
MKGIPQLCTIHACENPSPHDNLNDAAAQHSIMHNEALPDKGPWKSWGGTYCES